MPTVLPADSRAHPRAARYQPDTKELAMKIKTKVRGGGTIPVIIGTGGGGSRGCG
jgi:hypothetical protein